ncbi:hypothetical protein CVT24_012446 [Panaeolus cyanescens]|uniref:Uncharacterized protein n=1 Tax=Panaeolus cyanescens TaxID=181874 RepID=A0A409YJ95_9AGAR|nr:hypothetical protein CVT24_012446 [Panaeolus cyanescens]
MLIGNLAAHTFLAVYLTPTFIKHAFTIPKTLPILGCLVDDKEINLTWTVLGWAPTMGIGMLLFVMMPIKCRRHVSHAKSDSEEGTHNRVFCGPRTVEIPLVLQAFWTSGSSAFLLITGAAVAGTILCVTLRGPKVAMIQSVLGTIFSCTGCRLILNIREAAETDDSGDMSRLETMQFAGDVPRSHTYTSSQAVTSD